MHVSDVVAASTITAVALLIQAALTNWRDAVRLDRDSTERQKDREHEAAEATTARRQDVEDHWRDERLRAHAAYLEAVEAVSRLADFPLGANPSSLIEANDSVREAWARVQMLGSSESTANGKVVYDQSQKIAYYAMRLLHTDPKHDALVELNGVSEGLSDRILEYRDAARRDIGTEV